MIDVTNNEADITITQNEKSGRKRLYIAGGSVLAAAALLTAAAFTDFANINLGAGSGIGVGDSSFALLVADTDADGNPIAPIGDDGWVSASGGDGISYNLPGAEALEPNDSVTVDIPVRNSSSTLDGQLSVSFVDITETPSPVTDALLFSVFYTDADGTTTLFDKVGIDDANAAVESLLEAGAQGSFRVTVGLPNNVDASLQGQSTNLRFVLEGVSVTPTES